MKLVRTVFEAFGRADIAAVAGLLHQDVELFTPHYRGAHAASGAKAGFRIYVVASRGGGGRSGPRPRGMEDFL